VQHTPPPPPPPSELGQSSCRQSVLFQLQQERTTKLEERDCLLCVCVCVCVGPYVESVMSYRPAAVRLSVCVSLCVCVCVCVCVCLCVCCPTGDTSCD